MKKHVKKTAVFLAAALLCEAVMPFLHLRRT